MPATRSGSNAEERPRPDGDWPSALTIVERSSSPISAGSFRASTTFAALSENWEQRPSPASRRARTSAIVSAMVKTSTGHPSSLRRVAAAGVVIGA